MEARRSLFSDCFYMPYIRRSPQYYSESLKGSEEYVQRLKLEKKLDVHNGCVNTICWNDYGEYILSGSDDQHLVITNPFTKKVMTSIHSGHRANIFSARFLPNSQDRQIVSCSGDGIICYTRLDQDREEVNSFNCHFGTTYEILTVPQDSNSFLSCGEDGTVRWFDLRIKDKCNKEDCKEDVMINCRRAVSSLAIHPTFPYQLAVGCSDSTVRVYDRRMLGTKATGNYCAKSSQGMISRFSAPGLDNRYHRITSLAYSLDGEEILVSYSSEALYLFNLKEDGRRQLERCFESKEEVVTEDPVVIEEPEEEPSTSQGATGGSDGGASSPGATAVGGKQPPIKRLRLRGDWSDTGPNARPERERTDQGTTDRTAQTIMQRMSDMLTRWLEGANRTAENREQDTPQPSQPSDNDQVDVENFQLFGPDTSGATTCGADSGETPGEGTRNQDEKADKMNGNSSQNRGSDSDNEGHATEGTGFTDFDQVLTGEASTKKTTAPVCDSSDKTDESSDEKLESGNDLKADNPLEVPKDRSDGKHSGTCETGGSVLAARKDTASQSPLTPSTTDRKSQQLSQSAPPPAMAEPMISLQYRPEGTSSSTIRVDFDVLNEKHRISGHSVSDRFQTPVEDSHRVSTTPVVPSISSTKGMTPITTLTLPQDNSMSSLPSTPSKDDTTSDIPSTPSMEETTPSLPYTSSKEEATPAVPSSTPSKEETTPVVPSSTPSVEETTPVVTSSSPSKEVTTHSVPSAPSKEESTSLGTPASGYLASCLPEKSEDKTGQFNLKGEDTLKDSDPLYMQGTATKSHDSSELCEVGEPNLYDKGMKRPLLSSTSSGDVMKSQSESSDTEVSSECGQDQDEEDYSKRSESEMDISSESEKESVFVELKVPQCASDQVPVSLMDMQPSVLTSDTNVDESEVIIVETPADEEQSDGSGHDDEEGAVGGAGVPENQEGSSDDTGPQSYKSLRRADSGNSDPGSRPSTTTSARQRRHGHSGPPTGDFQLQSDSNEDNEEEENDSDAELMRASRRSRRNRVSSSSNDDNNIERHVAAMKLQEAYRKRQEEREREEQEMMKLPQPALKMNYRGHRNARTMIKESCFWGNNYVMSGSDCGHVFVWDRATGKLVMLLEGDKHVVNCVQPHPFDPILATSGIDYDVKIWTPFAQEPGFDAVRAGEIQSRNEVMLEETRDTITVPASFMLRMLASLNHFRAARDRTDRGRASTSSSSTDSEA